MVSHILKIKTNIPPLPANVLTRSGIIAHLDEGLTSSEGFTRPITLFSAPAGFGKTTLARSWLSDREDHTGWYSLDEGENVQERFWIYLISALQKIKSTLGNSTLEFLRSNAMTSEALLDTEALLTPLLNDLFALEKSLFLVLDDYHLINNPHIHSDMKFFIENLPPTVHLVVTTRSDPPWPLSRWRAKNRMVEIRLKDLKFSKEESNKLLLDFKGIELNEQQLFTLYNKTEGWITGLQLAAFSLCKGQDIDTYIQSFAGSHRHIFHFLSEEVFSHQPEAIQNFLLETSILNRFCAPLCQRVTGRADSADILAALERDNLFVNSLDDDGIWYRYHPLFADLLLFHLKNKSPKKVKELHEKAAGWFMETEEYNEAVSHSLESNNLDKVAQIIDYHHDNILEKQALAGQLIYSSLELLPLELLKKYPRLLVIKAFFLLIKKGSEQVDLYLQLAEKLHYDNEEDQRKYEGILEATKAHYNVYTLNFSEALINAEKSLKKLSSNYSFWKLGIAIFAGDVRFFSGNIKEAYYYYMEAQRSIEKYGHRHYLLSTGMKVGISLYYLGRLKESEEITLQLLHFVKEENLFRLNKTGTLWTMLGEVLREKGDLDEAERCIERGISISNKDHLYLGWNYLYKVALAFSKHKYEDALHCINSIEILNSEAKLPAYISLPAAFWKARILNELDSLKEARDLLEKLGITENITIQPGTEKGHLMLSRILLKENNQDYIRIHDILTSIEELTRRGDHRPLLLETLLVKTSLEESTGRHESAESCLHSALLMGEESGFFQAFLDEGRVLASVFTRLISKATVKNSNALSERVLNYALKIYAKISPEGSDTVNKKTFINNAESVVESPYSGLVEALSPREIEVLHWISQGLSNQDICQKLFLSMGTVKWHTSNIYGKLGVRGRTQAVALARKLNLIS